MKFLCAAAVAALAVSSLGCQAVKQNRINQGQLNQTLESNVQQASHVQQTSLLANARRGIRPALRPIGSACGDCGTECGCGEACGCGPCGECGGGGCGTCDGTGFCSAGNPSVNHVISRVLDCAPCQRANDGHYGFQPGPPIGQTAYPYYTVRGPRDFLTQNPRSIGPTGAHGCR